MNSTTLQPVDGDDTIEDRVVRPVGDEVVAAGEEEEPLATLFLAGGAAAVGDPKADVVDAVAVHVGGDGPFADADEVEVAEGERGIDPIAQATDGGQVEGEDSGEIGGQVVGAVAVEVADDGIAEQPGIDGRIRR